MMTKKKISQTVVLFTLLLLGLLLVVGTTDATRILPISPHYSTTVDAVVVTLDDNSLHRRRGARTRDHLEVYENSSSEKKNNDLQQQDGSKSKKKGEEKVTYESESLSTVVAKPTTSTRSSSVGSLVTSDEGSHKIKKKHTPEHNSEELETVPNRQETNNDEGGRGELVIKASRGKSTRNKGNDMKENGNGEEHFRKVAVDVYRRQIPKISVSFRMEDEPSHHQQQRHTPIMVDYNELSQVSEDFVNHFFRTILEEEEVQVRIVHEQGVHLFVSVNEDKPFVVDFVVTLAFVIPGQVPTVKFLSDRLHDGLKVHPQLGSNGNVDDERDPAPSSTSAFFVANLRKTMSQTNPFSKTVSIEVVRHSSNSSLPVPSVVPSVSDTELTGTSGTRSSRRFISMITTTELGKHIVIASFLAGMGCVILIATAMRFRWENKKTRHHHEDTTDTYTTITTATTTTTRTNLADNDHSTTDQTISALTLTLAFDDDELN